MTKTTSLYIAVAFMNDWVYPYGIPGRLLTDNGSQFIAQFFEVVCKIIGTRHTKITAYHPQTNGQAERYNGTLVTRLRHYVAEHQTDWDEYIQPLTYAYNTQVHQSTGTSPFALTLSRHPPSSIVDTISTSNLPDLTGPPSSRTMSNCLIQRFGEMFKHTDGNIRLAQENYKQYYDRFIRAAPPIKKGDKAYVHKPPTDAKTAK